MKVSGKITTVKNETVEIDPSEVTKQLKLDWMKRIGIYGFCYLNKSNQMWEDWENTGHGSGITTEYRKATEDEIQIWDMFEQLEDFMSGKTP